VVLNNGTGSGLLAMLPCRWGSGGGYAIERGHILGVVRELARHNGLEGRIEFFAGHSTKVELPEWVDLVVVARRGFLPKGGRLLPEGLDLCAAPTAEGVQFSDLVGPLRGETGLEFGPLLDLSSQVSRNLWAEAGDLLVSPGCLMYCDL